MLLVDADREFSASLRRVLERDSVRVTLVHDFSSAAGALEEERFDVVVLDLGLGAGAMARLLEIVSEPRRNTSGTLVLASGRDGEDLLGALRAGASDFVLRPAVVDTVANRVRHRLRPASPTGDAQQWTSAEPAAVFGYCPACLTIVRDPVRPCGECGATAPPDGFPPCEAAQAPLLGVTIAERYAVERFIDRGAVSTVYRARDLHLRRRYAIKHFDASRAFSRVEAELLQHATVDSPYVVRVYEVHALGDGSHAAVMDFVDGETLASIVRRHGPVAPERTVEIVRQLALGVAAGHRSGVVHRDIKPDNVMVETLPDGAPFARLLDFGLARPLADDEGSTFHGSVAFAAPEQLLDGRLVDERADLYGLGMTMLAALVGTTPTESLTAHDLAARYMAGEAWQPRELIGRRHDLAPVLPMLYRVLSFDPAKRPPSARAMKHELDAVLVRLHTQ